MTTDLKGALVAAAARLRKEKDRPASTPSTEQVGGLIKIGVALDGVMRAVFVLVCDEDGEDPEVVFTKVTRRAKFERATSGELVTALAEVARGRDSRPPPLRIFLADAARPASCVRHLVELRNKVKTDELPPRALLAQKIDPVLKMVERALELLAETKPA